MKKLIFGLLLLMFVFSCDTSGDSIKDKPEIVEPPAIETPGTETPGTETPGTDTPGTDTGGTTKPVDPNLPTYKIIFNLNGGTGEMATIVANEGQVVTLPTNSIVKSGGKFTGWNTVADGTGTAYNNKATVTVGTADINLYPMWGDARFITQWVASTGLFHFPLDKDGDYDFMIDWGDGTIEHITQTADAGTKNYIRHTYKEPWSAEIIITGKCHGFGFSKDRRKISIIDSGVALWDVKQWGNVKLHNKGRQFFGCNYLKKITATDNLNLNGITNMSNMFRSTWQFNDNLKGWDTSSVTNMSGMFSSARKFNSKLEFDTSNVMYSVLKHWLSPVKTFIEKLNF